MENALLYSLSTVAQALAGTLALLAAFALYKMQSFETELRDNSVSAIQPFGTDSDLLADAAHGRYAELLTSIECHLTGAGSRPKHGYNPWQAALVERMKFIVCRKAELSIALWRSVVITLATMSGAVIALTMVPQIKEVPALGGAVLAVAACFFLVCVGTYVPLLRSLLR